MQIFIYLKKNKMKYNLYQFTQNLFEKEKGSKDERKGERERIDEFFCANSCSSGILEKE